MKKAIATAALTLLFGIGIAADEKKKPKPSLAGTPTSSASSQKGTTTSKTPTTAPSLAKQTKLPPGLAKKFGKKRPNIVYVAFDPRRTDQAWLLIDGKWKLERGFDPSIKREVKASLALPVVRPPVPLPKRSGKLRVVKFN